MMRVCEVLYLFGFSYLYKVSEFIIVYLKVSVSPVKEVVCYLLRPRVIHAQVVSIEKSCGEGSLIEQNRIQNVSWHNFFFQLF